MKLKNFIFPSVLSILFAFLFFFRLGWTTLVSWDEAWYASIAREILRRHDWLNMVFSGQPYYDHPPMGFWLMAISYILFGINEFTTRLPSALLGLFSIILVYLTAIELFKKRTIGFVAALILGTSVWYLIRVRAGDLDSTFVFFYILTVYLTLKSSKNFNWFPLTMAAFGGLILSKTLVGWSAGILIFFWDFKQAIKSKKNLLITLSGVLLMFFIVLPWYYVNDKNNIYFVQQHFINTGFRKRTNILDYFKLSYQQPLFYLHMGVRKWYYLWIAALALIMLTLKFLKKPFVFLLLWNFIILYPFLTTDQTQIWHLIPVYLPMSLIIATGFYYGGFFVAGLMKKIKRLKPFTKQKILDTVYVLFFVVLTIVQIKNFYVEVYPTAKNHPDDVDISQKVAKYKENIFLDDDFTPIAVYYSGRDVTALVNLPDQQRTMVRFFQSNQKDFVMITRNWAVNNLKAVNIRYKILEKNKSFSIVTRAE